MRTQTRTGARRATSTRTTSWPPPGTRTAVFALGDEVIGFTDTGTQTEEATIAGAPGSPVITFGRCPRPCGWPARARLRVRVTVDDTAGHLAPTLVDVAPDGSMVAISRGHLNLRFRDGLAAPKLLPAGEPVDATVRLAPQDQTVPAGHRIGVILAGSNAVWALPAAGVRTLSVDLAKSALELPVVGEVGQIPGATAPERVLTASLTAAAAC